MNVDIQELNEIIQQGKYSCIIVRNCRKISWNYIPRFWYKSNMGFNRICIYSISRNIYTF